MTRLNGYNQSKHSGSSSSSSEARTVEEIAEQLTDDILDMEQDHAALFGPDVHALVLAALRSAKADALREAVETGAGLIAAERRRHTEAEGWTLEHDDTHGDGSLAGAAACLAVEHTDGEFRWVDYDSSWISELRDKHLSTDRVRQLVIAGSLIAAEIDRLLRARAAEKEPRG